MLPNLIERGIELQERELGVQLEYLRYIAQHAPGAALRLNLLKPLNQRRRLPVDAFHVARVQAAMVEGCGGCAQLEVNRARREGVPHDVLRAVLSQHIEDLPEDLADVARFAWAVVHGSTDSEGLRERLRGRYGDEGLIELALATASVRIYPTVKRALGFDRPSPPGPVAIPT